MTDVDPSATPPGGRDDTSAGSGVAAEDLDQRGVVGPSESGATAEALAYAEAVTAYDIDPQKAIALGAEGVKPADTVADAAADADVLVLMVATAGQAESVLYGEGKSTSHVGPASRPRASA